MSSIMNSALLLPSSVLYFDEKDLQYFTSSFFFYDEERLSAPPYTAWRPHTPHITVHSPYNETNTK
ncbi:4998_t:CDS:2, partial [Funneliformis geosporum]